MNKVLVIIPTYNEIENIRKIIEITLKQNDLIDILVVDDNSPDGTANVVKDIMQNTHRVHILERKRKLGLGSAYVAGFKYGIVNGYDAVVEMDADFSHDPKVLGEMISQIEKYDMIIGSRYCNGVNVVNWPLRRLLLSFGASIYVRIITGMRIKDPTAGFNLIKTSVLKKIPLDSIFSDGYSFQIELKYRVWLKGFHIKEIPIIFIDRQEGNSKMSKKIVYEAIWMVWKLVILKWLNKLN